MNYRHLRTLLLIGVPLFLVTLDRSIAAPATEQGSALKLLASFETGLEPLNKFSGPNATSVPSNATEGNKSVSWTGGFIGWVGDQNWGGYDYLLVDFFNSGQEVLQITLEIKDGESKDYWSRVNYPLIIPPGKSTARVPTKLYVGEKARPGRPLKLSDIKSVILSRTDPANVQELFLDNVRLLQAAKVSVEGVTGFDFGTYASPIFEGMKQVTKHIIYGPGQSFGFKDAVIWDPYPQASDALQPDPLYRDSVLISKAKFLVDLPNGKYIVFMNIDHPGGYWGEYPLYRQRQVLAEGLPVVDEVNSLGQAKERFFEFYKSDDHFEDNTFDKYFSKIFSEKQFEVNVTDGSLTLEFVGHSCERETCFGIALSTLIIAPIEKRAAFETFLNLVRQKRREEFDSNFHKYIPQSPGGSPSNGQGLMLFTKDYMQEIPTNYLPSPEEIGAKIEGSAALGEQEPLSFGIYPKADVTRAKITVSDLVSEHGTIPSSAIEIGIVSQRLSRMNMDGTLYTVSERYVWPKAEAELYKGRVARVWATVTVPNETPAGLYRGTFQVTSDTQEVSQIAIEFRVYPFTLEELDFPVGPFNSNVQENYWYESELGERLDNLRELSLTKMRRVGLTAFTTSPRFSVREADGKVTVDSSSFDWTMKRAKELGFKSIVGYGDLINGFDICSGNLEEMYRVSPRNFYSQFAQELGRNFVEKNWLPVRFIVCDEPLDPEIPRILRALSSLNETRTEKLRFTTTYSTGPGQSGESFQFVRFLPFSFLSGFDDRTLSFFKEKNKPWGFYNRASRNTFGFYMYRLRKETPLQYRLAWNWNQNLANPYFALDSREDDYSWCNSTPDGQLLCAVFLDRHIREGIDDYRYALTLEHALEKIKAPKLKTEALAILAKVREFAPGAEPIAGKNNPDFLRSGILRKEIASVLEKVATE